MDEQHAKQLQRNEDNYYSLTEVKPVVMGAKIVDFVGEWRETAEGVPYTIDALLIKTTDGKLVKILAATDCRESGAGCFVVDERTKSWQERRDLEKEMDALRTPPKTE